MNRTTVISERVSTRVPLGASVMGLVRGGARVGASATLTLQRAAEFDSDLRAFVNEVDDNPLFGKKKYTTLPADQKQKHAAFVSTLSGITYDWWGDPDELKGTKDYSPGFYRELKDTMWVSDGDLANVIQFENRLAHARGMYKAIGYKSYSEPAKKTDVNTTDPITSVTNTVSNVIWILGIGIAVYIGFAYVIPALVGAAATSRSATRSYREA